MTTTTATPKFRELEIIARDMYAAQGFTLSAEDRAGLVERADFIRTLTGSTARQSITVDVRDSYDPRTVIGYLTFTNL